MPTTIPPAAPAKYLTFRLNREIYGVPVLKVREIIRPMEITAVPQMPEFVKGVINLRGQIVPVVDLRAKFGLPPVGMTDQTCIVVLQVTHASRAKSNIGILVDAVEEVTSVSPAEMDRMPDFGGQLDAAYFLGLAKVKGAVTMLLDVDRLLGVPAEDGAS